MNQFVNSVVGDWAIAQVERAQARQIGQVGKSVWCDRSASYIEIKKPGVVLCQRGERRVRDPRPAQVEAFETAQAAQVCDA